MDIQQPEEEYVPAEGEEFFVIDLAFISGDDTNPPPTEVYLESDGSRRLVKNVSETSFGQSADTSFLASLPSGGTGASLLITPDGHSQTFDLETLERVEDPLTDTYLRRVLRQDLSDVVSLGPVPGDEREFTADVRLRSARITPHVPTDIGPERWADEGRMWLIVEYEYSVDSDKAGWSLSNTTLTWQVEDEPQVNQEGRWWNQRRHVIFDVPAEMEKVEISVALVAEVNELVAGASVKTFSPKDFEVTFGQ
ncbi:hypothetical protein ACQBAT_07430 [Ornithinimicrobium sp. Y1847]|uniref:hypothetical protein n=1 Tax=Ornithinimicrobium sp. Y1847 TaxID=3405419 RepID=UPI003B680D9A